MIVVFKYTENGEKLRLAVLGNQLQLRAVKDGSSGLCDVCVETFRPGTDEWWDECYVAWDLPEAQANAVVSCIADDLAKQELEIDVDHAVALAGLTTELAEAEARAEQAREKLRETIKVEGARTGRFSGKGDSPNMRETDKVWVKLALDLPRDLYSWLVQDAESYDAPSITGYIVLILRQWRQNETRAQQPKSTVPVDIPKKLWDWLYELSCARLCSVSDVTCALLNKFKTDIDNLPDTAQADEPATVQDAPLSLGINYVGAERLRQLNQLKFGAERDDQYVYCEMINVALCYLLDAHNRIQDGVPDNESVDYATPHNMPGQWPPEWDRSWWKPGNPVRNLAKAGALICAEIDRLIRLEAKQRAESGHERGEAPAPPRIERPVKYIVHSTYGFHVVELPDTLTPHFGPNNPVCSALESWLQRNVDSGIRYENEDDSFSYARLDELPVQGLTQEGVEKLGDPTVKGPPKSNDDDTPSEHDLGDRRLDDRDSEDGQNGYPASLAYLDRLDEAEDVGADPRELHQKAATSTLSLGYGRDDADELSIAHRDDVPDDTGDYWDRSEMPPLTHPPTAHNPDDPNGSTPFDPDESDDYHVG